MSTEKKGTVYFFPASVIPNLIETKQNPFTKETFPTPTIEELQRYMRIMDGLKIDVKEASGLSYGEEMNLLMNPNVLKSKKEEEEKAMEQHEKKMSAQEKLETQFSRHQIIIPFPSRDDQIPSMAKKLLVDLAKVLPKFEDAKNDDELKEISQMNNEIKNLDGVKTKSEFFEALSKIVENHCGKPGREKEARHSGHLGRCNELINEMTSVIKIQIDFPEVATHDEWDAVPQVAQQEWEDINQFPEYQ